MSNREELFGVFGMRLNRGRGASPQLEEDGYLVIYDTHTFSPSPNLKKVGTV